MRYGSGPSVTAVPDRANHPKRKVSMADIAESMSELDEEEMEKKK